MNTNYAPITSSIAHALHVSELDFNIAGISNTELVLKIHPLTEIQLRREQQAITGIRQDLPMPTFQGMRVAVTEDVDDWLITVETKDFQPAYRRRSGFSKATQRNLSLAALGLMLTAFILGMI